MAWSEGENMMQAARGMTAFSLIAVVSCADSTPAPFLVHGEILVEVSTDLGVETSTPDPGPLPEADGDAAEPACTSDQACASLLPPGPCQISRCVLATGACVLIPAADGAPCDDEDSCTLSSACAAGVCTSGVSKPCDDNDGCTEDSCDPVKGCVNSPAAGSCDDGNGCTTQDACTATGCAGQPSASCACQTDAECSGFDDGDLCTGVVTCQSGQCAVAAGSLVTCPVADTLASTGGCATSLCVPATGNCEPTPLEDGTACVSDGVCQVGATCAAGLCVGGTASVCDDANPCTEDSCDPGLGCAYQPLADGIACDDGSSCTVGDECTAGSCKGVGACACQADAECAGFDDGDACTGLVRCLGGRCTLDPATVPVCDDGNPCTQDACDSASGACSFTPLGGSTCDDGDPCTIGDQCVLESCQGTPKACEDADPCTWDACNPLTGACVATKLECDDQNPCTQDACAAGGQCLHAAVDGPCDDGDPCTAGDTCGFSACQPGAPTPGCCATDADCDDGYACSIDACAGTACFHGPVACDDGIACSADLCDPADGSCGGASLGAEVVLYAEDFDDGAAQGWELTSDNPQVTWQVHDKRAKSNPNSLYAGHLPDPSYDYGDTTARAQLPAVALPPGTTVTLSLWANLRVEDTGCGADDLQVFVNGELQVDAVCDTSGFEHRTWDLSGFAGETVTVGIAFATFGADHNDDEGAYLDDVEIRAGAMPGCCAGDGACDDADPCTIDLCPSQTWMCEGAAGTGGPCQDGSACTTGDTCLEGKCSPGTAVLCDDGNDCTADSCDPASGCAFTAGLECCTSVAECNDSNPCTSDACSNGKCLFATAVDGTACEDGNLCTGPDACTGTSCGGAAVVCQDGNACTADACDPATGCTFAAIPAGSCDDSDPCTGPDTCTGTVCGGAAVSGCCTVDSQCSDGKDCTTDACPDHLCVFTDAPLGTPCSDGDACTAQDGCDAGSCKAVAVLCQDGNECTQDSCDPILGCAFTALPGNGCDDKNPCTSGDTCQPTTCVGTPVAGCCLLDAECDDGFGCTVDVCDTDHACVLTPLDCQDDQACTVDWCQGGACGHALTAGGSLQPLYLEDFDDGEAQGWSFSTDNPEITWHVWDKEQWSDPNSLHAGKFKATSYDSKKAAEAIGTLPPLALPGAGTAILSFHSRRKLTGDGKDGLRVLVNGTLLPPEIKTDGGFPAGVQVDLGGYLGQTVHISFVFFCDSKDNGDEGVFIDDVQVAVSVPAECPVCTLPADCDDGSACTLDACQGGKCVSTPACDDGAPCTADMCVGDACTNVAWGGGSDVVYAEDFDDDAAQGWSFSTDNLEVTWSIQDNQSASDPNALYAGNLIDGTYNFGPAVAIASAPPIALPPANSARLTFKSRIRLDESNGDDGVRIVVNGVLQLPELTQDYDFGDGHEYVLDAFLGQTVNISLVFFSDSDNNDDEGAYLDDVSVVVIGSCP
jgi:hypothetical protein